MAQRVGWSSLAGGSAGIGAARKLKGVDAEVVLIDRHDYHTFSPMLYQVATDLVGSRDGRAPAARPVRRAAERHRAPDDGNGGGSRGEARLVRGHGADHLRLSRVGSRRRRRTSSGCPARREHAFPLYSLPDAMRLKDHILRAMGGRRPRSVPDPRMAR